MKNIYSLFFGIIFVGLSCSVNSSTEVSHITGDTLLSTPMSLKPYTTSLSPDITSRAETLTRRIYAILDGEESFDVAFNYFSMLDKVGTSQSVSYESFVEFYKSLGAFYVEKNVFDKAGEAYYRALKLPVIDESLRNFVSSTLHLDPESTTAEAIGKSLSALRR